MFSCWSSGQRARLGEEARHQPRVLGQVGVEHLHRHALLDEAVLGQQHRAHAAPAQLAHHLEAAEPLADERRVAPRRAPAPAPAWDRGERGRLRARPPAHEGGAQPRVQVGRAQQEQVVCRTGGVHEARGGGGGSRCNSGRPRTGGPAPPLMRFTCQSPRPARGTGPRGSALIEFRFRTVSERTLSAGARATGGNPGEITGAGNRKDLPPVPCPGGAHGARGGGPAGSCPRSRR